MKCEITKHIFFKLYNLLNAGSTRFLFYLDQDCLKCSTSAISLLWYSPPPSVSPFFTHSLGLVACLARAFFINRFFIMGGRWEWEQTTGLCVIKNCQEESETVRRLLRERLKLWWEQTSSTECRVLSVHHVQPNSMSSWPVCNECLGRISDCSYLSSSHECMHWYKYTDINSTKCYVILAWSRY